MLLLRNKPLRQLVAALETGNLLFLRLLFKDPSAARLYPGEVYRAYLALARDGRWPCRSIFEIMPNPARVRFEIEHIPTEVIATPLEQLACLAILAKSLAPDEIFEIGTFRGRTALNFALNSPTHTRVFTLDLPPQERGEATDQTHIADSQIIAESKTGIDYRGTDVEGKIEQLYGNSRTFDFTEYYGRIGLVFVDGAHDYETVCSDSENAIRMLKPGGYALWDEFCNFGDYNDVTRAVLDVVPAGEVIQIEHTQLAVYRKR